MQNDYVDIYPDTHWHHHYPNDTRAALVAKPGHSCCESGSSGDECVCVTQSDVEYWNQVSAITALSGIDAETISSVPNLIGSATFWNNCFNTVRINSANWNNISAFDDFSSNTAFWQRASNTVKAYSADWITLTTATAGIAKNRTDIDKLSADFAKQVKTYFSTESISGTGTINQPYGVKNYIDYIDTVNRINSGFNQLYPNGKQGWVSLTAESDIDGINPYQKALFSAVAVKDTDQDKTLVKHGELIEWLIKHLNGIQTDIAEVQSWITDEGVVWRKMNEPASKSDLISCTAKNTVYFSCD